MRIVKNIMKKKIIIISIFIAFLLAIIIFCGMKSFAGANTVINEEKMVRMVAGLSRAKDSNNTINTSILQTELNNYVGSGLTTVVDGTDVITVTFTETGNEYEIYKNPTNTITYNANGGTGTVPDSQTKQYGHRIQVASSQLTRSNYSFKGWSKISSATTPTYKPGEYYIDNADTTLYAVWSADELVLYDNGVFCEESGPMVKNSTSGGTFSTNYNDTDKDDTCVYFYRYTNDGYTKGRMATTNPIDVTPYDKITITYRYIAEYSDAGIRGECLFGLSETPKPDISGNSSAGTNFKNACVASGGRNWASSSGSTIRTTEIDISNISGSYYFTWFLQNYNESVYGYLYSVVLSQDEKEGDGDYLWNYGNVYGLADLSEWDTYAHDTEESHSGNKPTMDAQGRLGVYHRGADDQTTVCPTPIDVTDYATITFVLDAVSGNTYGRVGLMAGSDARYSGFSYSKNIGTVLSEGFTPRTFTVDISDATGEYYLGFRGNKGGMTYYSQVYLSKEWPTRTITYNANGGSNAPAVQYKQIEKDTTITTEEPTKNGYYFLGWSEDKNATIPTYIKGSPYTKDENITLYAVWSAKGYSIVPTLKEHWTKSDSGSYSVNSSGDITLNCRSGSDQSHIVFNNTVDLSKYDLLYVTVTDISEYDGVESKPHIRMRRVSDNVITPHTIYFAGGPGTYVIDVSEVTDTVNFNIAGNDGRSISISEIYFTKLDENEKNTRLNILDLETTEFTKILLDETNTTSERACCTLTELNHNGTSLNIKHGTTTSVMTGYYTKVDVTRFNTMDLKAIVDDKDYAGTFTFMIGLFDEPQHFNTTTMLAGYSAVTKDQIINNTYDISELEGEKYLMIVAMNSEAVNTYPRTTITELVFNE